MEKLSRSQVIQLAKTTGEVSGYDLSGLNLTYLDLIGVQFEGSSLKTGVTRAKIEGVKLDEGRPL